MQSRNNIAYLSALALLFSYAELLLPRFTPFFRLGLANAVILFALGMDFKSFLALCLIKSAAASVMAGTLFSPFFLVSISQSVVSGVAMFAIAKSISPKIISRYGISMLGSAASSLVQIFLCSLYLGSGTMKLLAPMLIFSIFSGIVTAFVCEKCAPDIQAGLSSNPISHLPPAPSSDASRGRSVLKIVLLVLFSATIFMANNQIFLCAALIFSLVLQKVSGRRIFAIPHLFLWLFVFLSHIFVPGGKVLFHLWKLSVTDAAVATALSKSLKLSAATALSQCAASVRFPPHTILGQTLCVFSRMTSAWEHNELKTAPLFQRIRAVIRGGEKPLQA
ncbi:MAG: Gx transporter family protein [Treponema sp.]|nr:Gx transporter family protein [Treponema sp.]